MIDYDSGWITYDMVHPESIKRHGVKENLCDNYVLNHNLNTTDVVISVLMKRNDNIYMPDADIIQWYWLNENSVAIRIRDMRTYDCFRVFINKITSISTTPTMLTSVEDIDTTSNEYTSIFEEPVPINVGGSQTVITMSETSGNDILYQVKIGPTPSTMAILATDLQISGGEIDIQVITDPHLYIDILVKDTGINGKVTCYITRG